MNNELITKNNERVTRFMKSLERMTEGIGQLAASCRSLLSGERHLTDKELSVRLKVSRRTLQDYRNEGRLPYILLGGKILYRESDIEKILEEEYREAFR
ncbi:MAG: helix-turn-helix domain-containing protein, partial [Odoribacter sp.]|nr:helix-turn-helix domain-containing protein [Odoribacter sp.]